jgi:hypothetical protein
MSTCVTRRQDTPHGLRPARRSTGGLWRRDVGVDVAAAASTATLPTKASATETLGRPRKPSTSDLLDRAYAVVADGSPADELRWWATIWPIVKRIESRLRGGAEHGDPGDERRLGEATERFLY